MSGKSLETALQAQKQRLLAALEETKTVDATPFVQDDETLSSTEYVTLVYEFQHVHLPELVAEGLVEFDPQEDEVRRSRVFSEKRRRER